MKSDAPKSAFYFLQRLSAFFNGFPLSPTAFWFSSTAFLFPRNPIKSIYGGNGFPLSLTAFQFSSSAFQFSSTAFRFSSMAFLFPRNPRKSIYGGKYTKDHHSSFVCPATCSPSFVIATRSPSFIIATRSPSFVIATPSPSFVIATMRVSHPTHSCGAPVFPTVRQI